MIGGLVCVYSFKNNGSIEKKIKIGYSGGALNMTVIDFHFEAKGILGNPMAEHA
jgi:hypothetical protein